MNEDSSSWAVYEPTFEPEYFDESDDAQLMPYTYTTSPTTTNARLPRYLRRYSISRPTSPLANSFLPDDEDSDSGHYTNTSHGFSSSNDHRNPRSPSKPSPSPTFNPGPTVHQYRHTTVPPSSASSVFATVISAAPPATSDFGTTSPNHFHSFDLVACGADRIPLSSHPRTRSRSSSLSSSSASVYSSEASTECSFHTAAADDLKLPMDNIPTQGQLSQDFRLSHLLTDLADEQVEDRPSSWADLAPPKPILNDSSDSATSGSAFGFASRGAISSSDTEPDLPQSSQALVEAEIQNLSTEWPLTYLTSISKDELERAKVQSKTERRFTWGGGKSGRKDAAKGDLSSAGYGLDKEADNDKASTKSRKLKKKRNSSVPNEALPQQVIENIDFNCHEGLEGKPNMLEVVGLAQGAEVVLEERKPLAEPLATHGVQSAMEGGIWLDQGRLFDKDLWITTEHLVEPQVSSDQDTLFQMTIAERVLSRTPQEILQGLDVVHEVTEDEEEGEDAITFERHLTHASECGWSREGERYQEAKNKGKERAVATSVLVESQAFPAPLPLDQEIGLWMNGQHVDPVTTPEYPSSSKQASTSKPQTYTPRKKLSKKRRSRRALQSSSIRDSKSNVNRLSPGVGKKPRRPSVPTLRPRRTPKTLLSSLRVNVFRSLASVGLILGIDVADGKRLSQELRTPNTLVLGRHFSEKHIPRFPSRLDGIRSVDKKVATYEAK